MTIYDYPRQVQTYPTEFLVSWLKQNDVSEFPIVMCKAKKHLVETKDRRNPTRVNAEIVFTGFDAPLVSELDFGHQPEGSLVRCSFTLKNMSSALIKLGDIQGDCKCSEIVVDETRVSPGKSCTITTDVSLAKRYKDIAVKGRATIRQPEGVLSTRLMVLIKGYSEPRVLCKPQKIDFGTIKSNSGLAVLRDIRVQKTECAEDQTITRIGSTASNVAISDMRRSIDAAEFDITVDSTDAVGLQTSKINVFLDNETEPASWFDVTVLLQRDYSVAPEMALVKRGSESVVTIIPKEKRFAIERVSLLGSADCFQVSFSNGTSSSSVHISTGTEEPPQRLIHDLVEVVIRFKDTSEEETLKIPMTYIPDK